MEQELKTRNFDKGSEYVIETALGITTARYIGRSDEWHIFSAGEDDKKAYIFMDDQKTIESSNPIRELIDAPKMLRYTPDTKKLVPVYLKRFIKGMPKEIRSELERRLEEVGEKI